MKHLTVVYTINDEEAFKHEMAVLMSKFKRSDGEAWAITAMSRDHEMNRVSLIEDAVSEDRLDLIEDILGMTGNRMVSAITDMEGH